MIITDNDKLLTILYISNILAGYFSINLENLLFTVLYIVSVYLPVNSYIRKLSNGKFTDNEDKYIKHMLSIFLPFACVLKLVLTLFGIFFYFGIINTLLCVALLQFVTIPTVITDIIGRIFSLTTTMTNYEYIHPATYEKYINKIITMYEDYGNNTYSDKIRTLIRTYVTSICMHMMMKKMSTEVTNISSQQNMINQLMSTKFQSIGLKNLNNNIQFDNIDNLDEMD